jgi:hypothetical protein
MATDDVYQLRLQGNIQGQGVELVHFYQSTGALSSAVELAGLYRDDVVAALKPAMNIRAFLDNVFVINGNDNSEYANLVLGDAGTWATGSDLPPHFAFAFRSPYPGPGKRYSYKRLWGPTSSMFTPTGGALNVTINAILSDICIAFGAELIGATVGYTPVQVTGGFKLGVVPTVAHLLIGTWACYYTVSTQKTRQNYFWN